MRSAAMHDLELPEGLAAVARAGAGVNINPYDTFWRGASSGVLHGGGVKNDHPAFGIDTWGGDR